MRARHFVLLAGAIVLGYGASCTGFREDEVACEQTVAHLSACCPRFSATKVDCTYSETHDCSDRVATRQYPTYSLEESTCLQRTSCDDLVARGLCEKAQAADPPVEVIDAGSRNERKTPLCLSASP